MTTEYRYLVEDVMTGEIGELPLNNVVYEDYLRRPGALNATLSLADADANVELLDVGRRAYYVMRDQSIEWGGLLMHTSVELGGTDVQLTGLGWPGWFDMRDMWIDRQFSATDQFEIFKTLVDDSQDETNPTNGAGADLGITVTWSTLSGVLRDRLEEYRYFSGKNLGAALRELAALEDGFDFRMDYAISAGGGSIDKSLVLSYPSQGVDRSAEVGFEYVRGEQSNILRRGLSHDASRMAWRKRGWGAGADVSRLLSTQINESRRGVYPFLDGQGSFSSVVQQATLDDNTAASLATDDHVIVLPSIEVDPDIDPKWHTYGIGDTFSVNIDDGYCSASGAHRIIGYRMDADRDRPTLLLQAA